jgi:hypothetical protein
VKRPALTTAARIARRAWPLAVVLVAFVFLATRLGRSPTEPQPVPSRQEGETIARRIPPPPGYDFVRAQPGSFEEWLAQLPLKPGRPPVRLHDGSEKPNQDAHHAVMDIDVGARDLQQCADAIIRLRAEYLWAAGRYADIHFNFTSGDRADYERWREGYRPLVVGDNVSWVKSAGRNESYESFRDYLTTVFRYAGTHSLSAELSAVPDVAQMKIGDVFIRGGFPGHAVIVVNMAEKTETRERLFLLAQSYMPAQDIHILSNPTDPDLSPWYSLAFGDRLKTPEYTFRRDELRRF